MHKYYFFKTLIGLFTLVMQQANAQITIVLNVDNNCNPSISVNDRTLINRAAYDLPLAKNGGIRFLLNNTSVNKQVIVQLQKGKEGFGDTIQRYFKMANPLATDDLFRMKLGGLTVRLDEAFTILLGCAENPDVVAEAFFVPLINQQALPTGTAQSDKGNASPASTAAENPYKPGSAVYDALKLADSKNLSEDELQRIATFYYPKDGINDVTKAKNSLKTNPFLTNVEFVPEKPTALAAAQSGGQLLSSLSLSSIGGLDVTNIVDGLAKFLVKRTKEELNTAFFQKFKEELDKYADLKTLFPKTVDLLGSIGSEVYNYQKYIQNLREVFKDDIENLYENLPGIINNHEDFFNKHHTLAASLRSGCYLVGALQQKVHPGDVLANYPLEYLDTESPNWKGSVQTLQLLSASMRDTSTADNAYWVKIKYLRQLVNNKKAFVIYLALLHQIAVNDYDNVPFKDGSLVDLLKNAANRIEQVNSVYNAYKTYILGFAEKTDALNSMIAGYTKPANDSLAIELYKKYFDASQDLIEYASQVSTLPLLNQVSFLRGLPDTLAPYIKITNLVTDLMVEINRKNYSAAINNAILIYDWVRNKPAQRDLQLAAAKAATTEKAAANDPARMANQAALATVEAESTPASNTLSNLAKYGAFMSTVATAKTSDEVAAAIEAFALPSGSSRIKRQSNFNVALNAYVGVYGGGEYLPSLKKKATAFSAGLTAPVGVAISWGKKGCGLSEKDIAMLKSGKPKGSSYTLFVSLIDIGAAAAFRFGDTSSSITSTIQLKNIIAPGLYLYYGFRNSPFSVGLGGQLGPQLRKISASDINIGKEVYVRFGLSFAVDIPLLNFYTRTK